jgi:hypothetical protein
LREKKKGKKGNGLNLYKDEKKNFRLVSVTDLWLLKRV